MEKRFERLTLETCSDWTGIAVVIDVLRAFTTAAFAFDAGVREILLTDTVESAFQIKGKFPGSLVAGEVDGYPVPGFDYSNSPLEFESLDLAGRILVQRTSAGTQGVVRSRLAKELFAASFVCAEATARLLRSRSNDPIGFVITGGDEDAACADYLEAIILNESPDFSEFALRTRNSPHGRTFIEPPTGVFTARDLNAALERDRFDFAMTVRREGGFNRLCPI